MVFNLQMTAKTKAEFYERIFTFKKFFLCRKHRHIEKHFTSGEIVRDVVIGMADGLTVPFALAAGLSGAVSSTTIIVTAGLAEIVAGSIAMGLGGYLAGKSDIEHYDSEYEREMYEIEEMLEHEKDEVVEIFENYGLTRAESIPIVESLAARPKDFADFMMRFELGLEKPDPKRALQSGATIGGAYIFGGLIPLAPYIILQKRTSRFSGRSLLPLSRCLFSVMSKALLPARNHLKARFKLV